MIAELGGEARQHEVLVLAGLHYGHDRRMVRVIHPGQAILVAGQDCPPSLDPAEYAGWIMGNNVPRDLRRYLLGAG